MPRLPIDSSEATRLLAAETLIQQYRACILLQTTDDMRAPDAATRTAFFSLGLPTTSDPSKTLAETMQAWLQQRIKLLLTNLNPRLRPDAIACRNFMCFYFYNVEEFLSNSQLAQRLPNIASLHSYWERLTGNAMSKLPPLPTGTRKTQRQLDGVLPISDRTATNAIHAGLMLVFDIHKGSRRVSAAKPETTATVANHKPPAQPLTKLDAAAIAAELKRQIHDEPTRVRVQSLMQRGFAWMAETLLGQSALIKAARQDQEEWALLRGYVIRCVQHAHLGVNGDAVLRVLGKLALNIRQVGGSFDTAFTMTQALKWLRNEFDDTDAERFVRIGITCNLLSEKNDGLHLCSQYAACLFLIPIWVERAAHGLFEPDLLRELGHDESPLRHLLLTVQDAVLKRQANPQLAAQVVMALPIDKHAQSWAAVQCMTTALKNAWQAEQVDADERETLRKLNLWLIRNEPPQAHDVVTDLQQFNHALQAAAEDLDRAALMTACHLACHHFGRETQLQFMQPLMTLCADHSHWRVEILIAILRTNLPSAFELFLVLLRRHGVPSTDIARYVARSCMSEANELIAFDDARPYLAKIQDEPITNAHEIAFFVALLGNVRTQPFSELGRGAERALCPHQSAEARVPEPELGQ